MLVKITEWALHVTGLLKEHNLLGIKTVLAESFERIHRSNLVLMGVLPLQFKEGESAETLGLTGKETIDVQVDENVKPRDFLKVTATDEAGNKKEFEVLVRFDSEVEIDYYRHGGILPMVLREKLQDLIVKTPCQLAWWFFWVGIFDKSTDFLIK